MRTPLRKLWLEVISSCKESVDMIPEPVPVTDDWQEPRISTVPGASIERDVFERTRTICFAEDLDCRLAPQVTHHGNPGTIATHQIVNAFTGSHVWQIVEGERDVSSPRVR